MGNWNILIRDSWFDGGQIPTPEPHYTSPDIICTQETQVRDPQETFANNYNIDRSRQPIANQNNYIYVRGKNCGRSSSGGKVYLFWFGSALLVPPDHWKNNALQADNNGEMKPYARFPSVPPQGVTVTPVPFVWTPNNGHYCFYSVVSTPEHPWSVNDIPSFDGWDEVVTWVRYHPNIGQRNVTLIENPNTPQWDSLDLLDNSFIEDLTVMVCAKCTNVPVGTTVTLKDTNLNIDHSEKTTKPNQTIYSRHVPLPSGYHGYVETLARLPSGVSRWPYGAGITTTLHYGKSADSEVARFAHDFGPDEAHPTVKEAKASVGRGGRPGVLIALGSCSTVYQPTD
ncbi:MAG: hypothetical protein P8Z80_00825 [Pseudolabrys sp.]